MGSVRSLHSIDDKKFACQMKLSAFDRTKRNTAFVMLLVWLFAMASSVANACLLETNDRRHAVAANESASPTSRASAELPVHLGVDAGHHDDSDGAKESCVKVCDDGTRALPTAYSGVEQNDPGPAPLIATRWVDSPHVVSTPRRADDLAVPIFGPPLRVRYSRLAL